MTRMLCAEAVRINAIRRSETSRNRSRLDSLPHKERQVLDMILKCQTIREMVQQSTLSLRVSEDRRSRVMKRMGVSPVVVRVSGN